MQAYYSVAIVTLLSGMLCFFMAVLVSRTRRACGIAAPAMSGDPLLERTIRAHSNTLEWMPIFLPALWLYAIYWSPVWAAILGAVWIVGRLAYLFGYRAAPGKRFLGFLIQSLAVSALVLGAFGRVVYLMIVSSQT